MRPVVRSIYLSIAVVCCLAAPPRDAHALTYTVTELSSCPTTMGGGVSCVGAPITIGFRIILDPGEAILGLSASAYGYDEAVLNFEFGLAVREVFQGGIPAVAHFYGMPNDLVPRSAWTVSLVESSSGSNPSRVQFFEGSRSVFSAVSRYPYSEFSPGINPNLYPPDAQFRLTFRGVGTGTSRIDFGTGYEGDAAVFTDGRVVRSAGFQLVWNSDAQPYVIPEPGTAVLIGLGLFGLARRRGQATPASRAPTRSRSSSRALTAGRGFGVAITAMLRPTRSRFS